MRHIVVEKKSVVVSDLAPLGVTLQKEESVDNYILVWSEYAQQLHLRYGLFASIQLAQGIIESRSGTSILALQNNNHFGLKCFSRSCSKGHCSNFTDDTHKDFFRIFKTPEESWAAHAVLLSGPRYRGVREAKNYRQAAEALQRAGYATDPHYADKLIQTVEKYNLYKWDTSY